MKELHAEWFPIDYPQEFFDRMKNPNVIALGCFYNVCIREQTASEPGEIEPVLIGIIFSRVERECLKNELIIERLD